MRLLRIAALLLLASPASGQFVVTPPAEDERCAMSENVPDQVHAFNRESGREGGDRYTIGSIRDQFGRCTLNVHRRPFGDPLLGWLPTEETLDAFMAESGFPEQDGAYYLTDDAPGGWSVWRVEDHLGFLAGHVAAHNGTHTYLYFHRYGHATYVAVHTGGKASNQWSLLSPTDGAYLGAIYAADPPVSTDDGLARVDERLVNRFPFVYLYQFPYQPAPRRLRPVAPEYVPQLSSMERPEGYRSTRD